MLTGLLAGAAAALIAALLSLPLRSPDDALLHTGSVAVTALIAGVAAGALRGALTPRMFAAAWGGLFVATIAALAAGEAMLERMLTFGAPLAAVVFGVSGAVVWYFGARPLRLPAIVPLGAAAIALGAGIALAGEGDAAGGRLELPPAPPAAVAATGASTPVSTAVAAPTSTATVAAAGASGSAGSSGSGLASGAFTKPADLKGVRFAVGAGSQGTFTVNEKVAQFPAPNDAVMRSTALAGSVFLDGRPSSITLDLSTLSSDQRRRDDFIQQTLFRTSRSATFTVSALPSLPATYTPGQVLKVTVPGTLSINGADRAMSFDVEARLDGTRLNLVGRTSFVWADLGYRAPNTPAISVQDRVAVEVLLVAEAQQG